MTSPGGLLSEQSARLSKASAGTLQALEREVERCGRPGKRRRHAGSGGNLGRPLRAANRAIENHRLLHWLDAELFAQAFDTAAVLANRCASGAELQVAADDASVYSRRGSWASNFWP
jgi:hypothetical protein